MTVRGNFKKLWKKWSNRGMGHPSRGQKKRRGRQSVAKRGKEKQLLERRKKKRYQNRPVWFRVVPARDVAGNAFTASDRGGGRNG